MRLFVAIDLSPEVEGALQPVVEKLRGVSSLRTITPEKIHLTLKFLGEVSEGQVEKVKGMLAAVPFSSFKLQTTKFGTFPHVLWLGVKLTKDLAQLQQAIERAVRQWTLHDPRSYKPHLTLARFEQLTEEEEKLITSIERIEMKWKVDGFTLYESTLTGEGPVYKVRGRFP